MMLIYKTKISDMNNLDTRPVNSQTDKGLKYTFAKRNKLNMMYKYKPAKLCHLKYLINIILILFLLLMK